MENKNIENKKNNYLITYVYYETPKSIINLKFFLKNGIVNENNVNYNFIIKNKCSVEIPDYDNINIIKTNNEGYDFGGYSDSLFNIDIKKYKYFIFLNDTVRGPFLPRYVSKNNWYKYFTSLIDDKTKLVGSSINYLDTAGGMRQIKYDPHIQSMAFSTDNIGIDILIKNNIFNKKLNIEYIKKSKINFIRKFEIGLSRVLIKNGYKITALHQSLNNKNIIKHKDIHYIGKYFNSTLNPVEIMFIKTNRINNIIISNYTKWNS